MPLIKYSCQSAPCGALFSVFVKNAKEIKSTENCKVCGNSSKRLLSAPNSSSKISIDNGIQARSVEVDPNIMELREEWTKPPNRGD